jgi:hypothetical protein
MDRSPFVGEQQIIKVPFGRSPRKRSIAAMAAKQANFRRRDF